MRSGLTAVQTRDGELRNSKPAIVTLVGQPNSGKTTLFNLLTGSSYTTSNYPGTTVEFSSGALHKRFEFDATIIDVPGVTSLNAKSPDEQVTVEALFGTDSPSNVVVAVVDASQMSRQLYLTKQLIDAGFPTVVALTMQDLLINRNLEVHPGALQNILGCPVVLVNGRTGDGVTSLVEQIVLQYESLLFRPAKSPIRPSEPTEENILELFSFATDTEKRSLRSKGNQPDLQRINQEVFNTKTAGPDPHSAKLDAVLLHPWLGIVFFAGIMSILFTSIFWAAQPLMDLVGAAFDGLSDAVLSSLSLPNWLMDLVTQGIIGGAGTVFTFVPQIMILFLLLGTLEDSGYLARGAMIIDKPLSKLGLNGRSFVPMLSGFACAIPAIMAARTIPNRRERLLTIFIIPLMSCSARLPVYALLLAMLIPRDKPWAAGLALGAIYLVSLLLGGLAAGIINKFRRASGSTGLMLELPAYRKPILRFILRNTYYRTVSYLTNAGPIILLCSILIWAITYFPNVSPTAAPTPTEFTEQQMEAWIVSERTNTSYAATVGRWIEPALTPLGWDWRVGVALMSAFAAREVFVSAMILSLRITDDGDDLQESITQAMRTAHISGTDTPLFTPASTVALIVFFMIAMQCISTLAISRKETGSWRIPLLQQTVYTIAAYIAALSSVQLLNFFGIN